MKSSSDEPKDAKWQKSPVANLVRYVSSKTYYARFRLSGKLYKKSLETTSLTVAKLRLPDVIKEQQEKGLSAEAFADG
jgi:hypothetical protein